MKNEDKRTRTLNSSNFICQKSSWVLALLCACICTCTCACVHACVSACACECVSEVPACLAIARPWTQINGPAELGGRDELCLLWVTKYCSHARREGRRETGGEGERKGRRDKERSTGEEKGREGWRQTGVEGSKEGGRKRKY